METLRHILQWALPIVGFLILLWGIFHECNARKANPCFFKFFSWVLLIMAAGGALTRLSIWVYCGT